MHGGKLLGDLQAVGVHYGFVKRGAEELAVHIHTGIFGHLHAVPFARFTGLGHGDGNFFDDVDHFIFMKLEHQRAKDGGAAAGADARAVDGPTADELRLAWMLQVGFIRLGCRRCGHVRCGLHHGRRLGHE